jgi:hypothetical protein
VEPAFPLLPGQGEFDLPGFLAPIIKSGYTGPLSLEIFNDGFRAAPPRANAADGLRSLLYLEEKPVSAWSRNPACGQPRHPVRDAQGQRVQRHRVSRVRRG